jgi:hypothetical protein
MNFMFPYIWKNMLTESIYFQTILSGSILHIMCDFSLSGPYDDPKNNQPSKLPNLNICSCSGDK